MVELAFTLPIFFLLVFGLIDLGRAVYSYNALAEATREGARYGSVQARSHDDASRDEIEDYVLDSLVGVPNVTVTASCTPSGPFGCTVDDLLIVEAETDFEMITPLIAQIVGTLSLDARSQVVVSN